MLPVDTHLQRNDEGCARAMGRQRNQRSFVTRGHVGDGGREWFLAREGNGVEADRRRVLTTIRNLLKPGQILFVGVTDPINPKIESPDVVRDRVLEAAELIPLESLGTTDDCGFSPFADDTSTSRETAFAKIKSRVEGTAMAAKVLGV